MIRQPSSATQLYAWWRQAVSDPDLPRSDGLPECGWYQMRRVRGGPLVAVEIRVQREIDAAGELTGPERLVAFFDGESAPAANVWTYLTPISRAEFQAILSRRDQIPAMAATKVSLDLSTLPAMRP